MVEVGRQHHPCEHVLAVGGLHPALHHDGLVHLVEDVLVLVGQLLDGTGVVSRILGCDDIEVGRGREGVALQQQLLAVVHKLQGTEVSPLIVFLCTVAGLWIDVGEELLDLALRADHVEVFGAVPDAEEVEACALDVAPAEGIDVALPVDILLLAGSHLADAQAVEVGLIAVALHGQPGDVLAVGRELRILVVAYVVLEVGLVVDGLCGQRDGGVDLGSHVVGRLAEIGGLAGSDIIEEDVAVGRDAILQTGLLATGVGDGLGVGAPGQLFDASEGLHGTLVGLAVQHVNAFCGDGKTIGHSEDEGVLDALDVVVPVAIHEVGDATACGLGQVGGVLLDNLMEGDALEDDDVFAVGGELEALDLAVGLGQLLAVSAVGLHAPYLTTGDEGDGVVVEPDGIGLVLAASGEQTAVLALGIHHIEHLMALVLLDAVVAHLIDNLLAVGRRCRCADASHGPQGLGCHGATA